MKNINFTRARILQVAHARFKSLTPVSKMMGQDLSKLWKACLKFAWKVSRGVINLWAEGVQELILSGGLTLYPGERVRCGSDHLSQFVSHNGVTIHVIHYQGSAKATTEKFIRAIKNLGRIKKRALSC